MITGYSNNSRGIGVRSYQLILPSVVCSTHLAKKVAEQVGGVTFSHQHGCAIIGPDVAGVNDFFVALAGHPNIQSTVVLGLGCETIQGNELTDSITSNYPETEYVVIQESAGMAGALDSSIATARALLDSCAPQRTALEQLTIGVEGFPNPSLLNEFTLLAENSGHKVLTSNAQRESARNFAELIRRKCHVILSFPDANQPPTGLPLIPVITVANEQSPLHQALASEFDELHSVSAQELLQKVINVANGEKSKSESKKVGDIVVPRMVRSV